jgi:hypothetical protein
MGVFKVGQMGISALDLTGEIQRVMSIRVGASPLMSLINLPGLISVPNSPISISNFEFILKSLT